MTRIGVIGTGIFANQKHLPSIAKTEGLEISGCFNRTTSKAEDFASAAEQVQGSKPKVYASAQELIEDPEIEVVDALLPVEENLSIVQQCLSAGKPVSFEKPIAATLQDARKIVELSESTDIPIMVLENWSFHHGTLKLKELLPKIGDIVMFNYQASGAFRLSPYHGTQWRQNPKHAGGFLSDGGVHDLALITDVLGSIDNVSAQATQWRPESGTIDTMNALFTMSNKTFGTYTQSRYSAATPFVLRFQIFGKNGTLVYEKPSGIANGRVTLYEGADSGDVTESQFELGDDEYNGVVAEFANWRDALKANDKSKVAVTPRKAFHHYAAISAAVESAQNGGKIVKVEQL